MKLAEKIFKRSDWYDTSTFGARNPIKTAAGLTSSFHNGTDYGTSGKNWAQYAIEDGYVFAAQKASDGALYVWVVYPRIKKALLHYHLKSYSVKAGQTVKAGTLLGYTGMTGKSTAVHLHLGVRDLSKLTASKINKMTWDALRECQYIDPHGYNYVPKKETSTSVLPKRGYFKKGDVSPVIGTIATFMYKNYPAYTKKTALGNTYGDNLIASIKEFQKRTGLVADGYIGEKTLAKLKANGLKL